jgi:hypothetical protein
MWIRSQRKSELSNVNYFDIRDYDDGKYLIYGNGYELGAYSTVEKVFKVLDKIQEHYNSSTDVFQMPQDEDVEVRFAN